MRRGIHPRASSSRQAVSTSDVMADQLPVIPRSLQTWVGWLRNLRVLGQKHTFNSVKKSHQDASPEETAAQIACRLRECTSWRTRGEKGPPEQSKGFKMTAAKGRPRFGRYNDVHGWSFLFSSSSLSLPDGQMTDNTEMTNTTERREHGQKAAVKPENGSPLTWALGL